MFDWFRRKPPATQRSEPGPKARAAAAAAIGKVKAGPPGSGGPTQAEVYTGTPGVRVYAGHAGTGVYQIDPSVISQGGDRVLQFILEDDMLEELMYNGSEDPLLVYHRKLGMCEANYILEEDATYRFVSKCARVGNTRIDETNPLFDGTLEDGSRINITVPPISYKYPSFTIRKFRRKLITVPDIILGGGMTSGSAAFLWCAIEGFGHMAANCLLVGGTGSGKTTTMNALSQFIPSRRRIVVIEDTRELQVSQPNAVRLVTTPEADMDQLLVNALRMRPDRILVGEVRGQEARTLFGAMNTGHDGCMGTLHANSARETIGRVTSPPMSVPLSQIIGLDLVIVQELKHSSEGPIRVNAEVAEVSGFGANVARLNQLFVWDEYKGSIVPTGIPSRLRTKICEAGGMEAADFSKRLAYRTEILEELSQHDMDSEEFMDAISSEQSI